MVDFLPTLQFSILSDCKLGSKVFCFVNQCSSYEVTRKSHISSNLTLDVCFLNLLTQWTVTGFLD